jgi:hypothetical protein
MEMRLGKTLVSIRWANSRPKRNKILVVCPKSVFDSWEMELNGEYIVPTVLKGSLNEKKFRYKTSKTRWFITNYQALISHQSKGNRAKPSYLATRDWDTVILDESPAIRNPKSKTSKICLRYLSQAPNKMILTGLPNPEGTENFVQQMIFLFQKFMGCKDYWNWQQNHTAMDWSGFNRFVRIPSSRAARQEIRSKCFSMNKADAGMSESKIYKRRMLKLPARCKFAIAKL